MARPIVYPRTPPLYLEVIDAFDRPWDCLGAEPGEGEPYNRPVDILISPTVFHDGHMDGPKFPSEVDINIIVIGEDGDDRTKRFSRCSAPPHSMAPPSDTTVVIPTLNEVQTIGEVVRAFRSTGFDDILVVDGGSDDGTVEAAREAGATVQSQTGSGKGQAVREAFEMVDVDIVLLVDGDGTYRPEDAAAMIAPIIEGEADHVIGDRFADMDPDAMTRLNRLGNRGINRVFELIHGRTYRDILSGYRAFSREAIDRLPLSSEGFGIETEIAVECARRNIATAVVPISYRPRPASAETNLRPFRDGAVIIGTLYRLAKTSNPLFYFGAIGSAGLMCALGLTVFVGLEWFLHRRPHQVLTVVGAVLALFGVQLISFGVLSEMIVSLRRYDDI